MEVEKFFQGAASLQCPVAFFTPPYNIIYGSILLHTLSAICLSFSVFTNSNFISKKKKSIYIYTSLC